MPRLPINLIVGLGNPGREYEATRHNAGFWLVEELGRRHGGTFRLESRFRAELARVRIGGQDCWLAKPQDYMNNSGRVAAAVAGFYKFEADSMLVAHDELDLAPGAVRLKFGGGAGGHNGLRDLIAQFGEDFWRLRLGVGHPGSRERVTRFLTEERVGGTELDLLLRAVADAADSIPLLLEQGAEKAMQQLHTRKDD